MIKRYEEERDIFERTKLIHKIVKEIRDRILSGELKEGEKLPSQDQLAANLGVSRGTLREGLNQLVMMNIIEMRQGSGTYVKSITPSPFREYLPPAIAIDKSYAGELLDARLYIEGAMALLAAKKATDDEIKELKKLVDHMRYDVKTNNIEDFTHRDLEFHLLIAKSSKNRVLVRVLRTIQDMLYQFIADYNTSIPESIKISMKYHIQIFKAIENRDQAGAKEKMESHIKSLIRRIIIQSKKSSDEFQETGT